MCINSNFPNNECVQSFHIRNCNSCYVEGVYSIQYRNLISSWCQLLGNLYNANLKQCREGGFVEEISRMVKKRAVNQQGCQ